MRAVICDKIGGPEILTISDIQKPTPKSSELLIKVNATALNRADLLQRRGKYFPPAGESNILGLEISGIVAEVGSEVTHFKKGDRVFGLVGSGGYSDYCLIDHEVALPIPEKLSFIEAAAIPEAFMTASEALFALGDLTKDNAVLIHAGGSGIGTAAIQLAKMIGATVFTTVGSSEKMTKIKSLSPDFMINYKTSSFADFIKQHHGVDVILDLIGANYLAPHLDILKSAGRLICVGLMGGSKTEIDLEKVLRKQLQIKGLVMRTRSLAEKRLMATHFKNNLYSYFENGKLHPVIDRVYTFDEIQEAHRYMESNVNVGKIVIKINSD